MILLKPNLPIIHELKKMNLNVAEHESFRADIKIGILNLMPKKEETELNFAKIFSSMEENVELHFIKLYSYVSKNAPLNHLDNYYVSFNKIVDDLDVLIFTGAPIEEIPFEDVKYWNEIVEYFKIIEEKKIPLIGVCWSAQAALYYYRNIQKQNLSQKAFGVFKKQIVNYDIVLNGIESNLYLPVSRHSGSLEQEILQNENLKTILISEKVGIFLVKDKIKNHYYITGHPEYNATALKNEYDRDNAINRKNNLEPFNYSLEQPSCFWETQATFLYHNIVRALCQK